MRTNRGSRLGLAVVLLAWSGWKLGFPAENCTYCHVAKLPKKGAVTYNDRGKWLVDQKDSRKAKEVDVAWLKDYPADKK